MTIISNYLNRLKVQQATRRKCGFTYVAEQNCGYCFKATQFSEVLYGWVKLCMVLLDVELYTL